MNIQNKITFLIGSNFSGKSDYFKKNLKSYLDINLINEAQLIKELPVNNISGIFSSVIEELNLHSNKATAELKYSIFKFLNEISFNQLFDKNPFSLSGGEQAILVLVCNLLLCPKELYIDSTIEQLNETWYIPFFDFINNSDTILSKIIVADNRYKEYEIKGVNEFTPTLETVTFENIFDTPKLINFQTTNLISKEILSIRNLSFAYSKKEDVFKNINYDFETGNIYHLNGGNGTGKSTLAKLITGVLKAPKNSIYVNGDCYNSYNKPGAICGYSFQNPDEQIFANNIKSEILPYQKKEKIEYTKRRDLYIKMFGLNNIRDKHPAEMPFVIRKRITLASTLAMERQWYILDEPTLGQDNNFVCFFAELLDLLCKNGKGIILISHCKLLVQKLNYKEIRLNQK